MFRLISKNTELLIDNLGIKSWSTTNLTIGFPSYCVFLKDYSLSDPSCRQWDNSSDIQLLNKSQESVEFIKTIENITSKCRISALDCGWHWTIQMQGEIPRHHRFGVAIGCGQISDFIDVHENPVRTNVSQYTWSPTEVFPDQTFLDMPILIQNGTNLVIFSSYNRKSQFFIYKELSQECLRLTASTTDTTNIEIYCIHSSEAVNSFISYYPNAKIQIRRSSDLNKIANKQGVSIVLQDNEQTFNRGDLTITLKPARHESLNAIAELHKYPEQFLSTLGLDGILICGSITCSNTSESTNSKCDGLILGLTPYRHSKWILWNASQKTRWAIHHEIYHLLEDNEEMDKNINWGGTIFSLPTEDCREHRADLFALLMTKGHQHKKHSLTLLLESYLKDRYPQLFLPGIHTKESVWIIQDGHRSEIRFGAFPIEELSRGDIVVNNEVYNAWH